jgi:Protein of unknown function (DUF2946)
MDDIVKAALKKWPNVPHCHGWLALDARGDWYMRDDRTQAAGPFPQVKGSRIQHDKLREFIERNYLADAQGAWFFQNGPQRVYVELEAAPWVWRLQAGHGSELIRINSHTGVPAHFHAAMMDEQGRLFLLTELGLGIVHSLDMEAAADEVEQGRWTVEELAFATLPARHGYCLSPAAVMAGASPAAPTATPPGAADQAP